LEVETFADSFLTSSLVFFCSDGVGLFFGEGFGVALGSGVFFGLGLGIGFAVGFTEGFGTGVGGTVRFGAGVATGVGAGVIVGNRMSLEVNGCGDDSSGSTGAGGEISGGGVASITG
jgi:hypothetical protein